MKRSLSCVDDVRVKFDVLFEESLTKLQAEHSQLLEEWRGQSSRLAEQQQLLAQLRAEGEAGKKREAEWSARGEEWGRRDQLLTQQTNTLKVEVRLTLFTYYLNTMPTSLRT